MHYEHTDRLGFLLYMSFGGLQAEIESVLGHRVQPYWKAYLLGIPTLFIYPLVWMEGIAEELKKKAMDLGIKGPYTSWRHMFLWNILCFPVTGPMVATQRFFDTLNKIDRVLNAQASSAFLNKNM